MPGTWTNMIHPMSTNGMQKLKSHPDTKSFQDLSTKNPSKSIQLEIKSHGSSHISKETMLGTWISMMHPMNINGMLKLRSHQSIKFFQDPFTKRLSKFTQLAIKSHGSSLMSRETMLGTWISMMHPMNMNGKLKLLSHPDIKSFQAPFLNTNTDMMKLTLKLNHTRFVIMPGTSIIMTLPTSKSTKKMLQRATVSKWII